MSDVRPLNVIARDIRKSWKKLSYMAQPYVEAMEQGDKITDRYIMGDYVTVVMGFLANSSGFRGEDARRIKAELKEML